MRRPRPANKGVADVKRAPYPAAAALAGATLTASLP